MEIPNVLLHDSIVRRAQGMPSREWVNAYLELMKRLLSAVDLESSDKRLSTSLPRRKDYLFPVTVNHRYVLNISCRDKKLYTGIICDNDEVKNLSGTFGKIDNFFNPLPGETIADVPAWLLFDEPQSVLDSQTNFNALVERARSEALRAQATPYRRFHQDVMYQLAVDSDYRTFVLEEAFGDANASPE